MSGHQHFWYASFLGLGFLGSTCPCGAKRFLGGYRDDRRNRIADRLNTTWRVR